MDYIRTEIAEILLNQGIKGTSENIAIAFNAHMNDPQDRDLKILINGLSFEPKKEINSIGLAFKREDLNIKPQPMNDKLNQQIQDQNRQLKAALLELKNENLTICESRQLHVEIEKLKFSINTLNFVKND